MAPECEQCNASMEGKGGGLRARLGMKSYSGYECPECGSLLCEECYRKRGQSAVGNPADTCPMCEELLQQR